MPRVDARRVAAVNAGKMTALASRALRRGGGTALPGIVAQRLAPSIARDLSRQLACGSIVVSGTNGKTTTARMLATVLRDAGYAPIRNESGSNLMRGVATSLVARANVLGNLARESRSVGLFEVDEAALPGVLASLQPSIVLLLNLFRDQLDRYGEVATVARLWAGALRTLPPSCAVVANADDPLLALTARSSGRNVTYFGLDSASDSHAELEHAADAKACPQCGGQLAYDRIFLGHLGHYSCLDCSFRRPDPLVWAQDVELNGVSGSSFVLSGAAGSVAVTLPLPGMYNVYNAVAAATIATHFHRSPAAIALSLHHVKPAFGRMERVEIEGREVYLALAKNPAGLNQVLRTALQEESPLHLLVLLNDNTADGHDVSWIWDADVEMLDGNVASVIFSGIRATDMALRFKYGGVIGPASQTSWGVAEGSEEALRQAIDTTPRGERLFIIPTYTALLDIRGALARLGYVRPYWEG